MVQARSRQCSAPGCGKRPVFNYAGEKLPVFCQSHKTEGMVDVLNRLCTHPGNTPMSPCQAPACCRMVVRCAWSGYSLSNTAWAVPWHANLLRCQVNAKP